MATDGDGDAVAAIYGPSKVTYQTDKGHVTITCDTDYPFSETLIFTVNGAEGASIPLTLRIPTWCTSASVAINGSPINLALPAGTFVKLPDAVKSGDVVTLILPMTIEQKLEKALSGYLLPAAIQSGQVHTRHPVPPQWKHDNSPLQLQRVQSR